MQRALEETRAQSMADAAAAAASREQVEELKFLVSQREQQLEIATQMVPSLYCHWAITVPWCCTITVPSPHHHRTITAGCHTHEQT